jgi:DNA-binding NtrC family response regulator
VVAATNQDLSALVQAGRFRQDLFQRLSVFPIRIPPLRERGDDILLLAEYFRLLYSERLNKPTEPFATEISEALLGYAYPGNVRELKNIIERAVILTESPRIELRHLPQRVLSLGRKRPLPSHQPLEVVPGVDSLADVEERMIRQAMNRARNVRTQAAKLLGISRFQLLRRMQKIGMQPESEKSPDKNS